MCTNDHYEMTLAEKIVEKQLAYYNANDLEGFTSTYTEDVEIYDLPSGALRFNMNFTGVKA